MKQSDYLIKRVNNLEEKVEENSREINKMKKHQVHEMLLEKHPYNPEKYANSYNDIANALGISKTTVFNIAKEFGITRKSKSIK